MKKKILVILRGYKLLHSLLPGYLPVTAVRAVFGAALPFVNIIISAMIINALIERREMRHVISMAVLAACLNFIIQVIMHFLKRAMSYLSSNIWWIDERPLNEKQQEMDYAQIEDPNTRLTRQTIWTHRMNGNGIGGLYWPFENIIMTCMRVSVDTCRYVRQHGKCIIIHVICGKGISCNVRNRRHAVIAKRFQLLIFFDKL